MTRFFLLFAPFLLAGVGTGWCQQSLLPEPASAPVEEAPVSAATVADPLVGDPAPLAPSGDEGYVVDRFEAAQLFHQFVENQDYVQALEAADTGLRLSEAELGPRDMALVPALNNMGQALLYLNQPVEARPYFERSLDIVRAERGIYAAEMFEPLMGIGEADQAVGRHEEAVHAFLRAQNVTHRSEGVYTLGQLAPIEEMVESLMAQDKWEEAENLQLTIFKLYRNNYGDESVASLPALYKLARWYHSIMDFRAARLLYRRSIDVIEQEKGANHPELITPLRGIAAAYLEERSMDFEKGLQAHQRIVAIADSHPDVSPETRVLTHLELGDWYVMFNEPQAAWREYRLAWELAQTVAAEDRDWAAYLGRPHLIYPGASLSVDFMGYGRVGDEVYYDFEFTILPDGRPDDIDILGTNLHGQTRSAALQAFRYARFRPRLEDGVAMETAGYKVRRVYPTPPPEDYGAVSFESRSGVGINSR